MGRRASRMPPPIVAALDDLSSFAARFSRAASRPRLLAIVSPT
jgi:hypothetical protein